MKQLKINTEVIPSSTRLDAVILNDGEFNYTPSQEHVEYFSSARVNVQVPPAAEANQSLKEYDIDSLNVQADEYIHPDYPYNTMSLVKINNRFLDKVQDRTIITSHETGRLLSFEPDSGYEATRRITVVFNPIITTFHGVGYSDRDSQRFTVDIPFSSLTVAQSDTDVPAIEGYGILIAYKLSVDPKFRFQFSNFYCIEFKRVEYFITSYKVKQGCAYIRFRDAQKWQSDVYYSIVDSFGDNLAYFRFPFVDHSGSNPHNKWPSLADTTACISFPDSMYSMPLLDNVSSFTENDPPYIINYTEDN